MVRATVRVPTQLVDRLKAADDEQVGWTAVMQAQAKANLDREDKRKERTK